MRADLVDRQKKHGKNKVLEFFLSIWDLQTIREPNCALVQMVELMYVLGVRLSTIDSIVFWGKKC